MLLVQVCMLQGRTPLHHAASASAYKVAKLLLLHGSKSTIKDIQVRAFAHVHAILLLLLLLWKSYAACVTESCIAHNVQQQRATASMSLWPCCKFAAACHSSLLHLIVSAWQQQSVLLADLCPLTRPSKTPFIAASLMVQTLVCLTGFDANFSLQQGAREQHTVDPCRRAEVRTA